MPNAYLQHFKTKISTSLLLNMRASTLTQANRDNNNYEYPISGDALTLLTGPAHTTVNIWDSVAC